MRSQILKTIVFPYVPKKDDCVSSRLSVSNTVFDKRVPKALNAYVWVCVTELLRDPSMELAHIWRNDSCDTGSWLYLYGITLGHIYWSPWRSNSPIFSNTQNSKKRIENSKYSKIIQIVILRQTLWESEVRDNDFEDEGFDDVPGREEDEFSQWFSLRCLFQEKSMSHFLFWHLCVL